MARIKVEPLKVRDCGICGFFHRDTYEGDCRNDEQRFSPEALDHVFGVNGWEIVDDEE